MIRFMIRSQIKSNRLDDFLSYIRYQGEGFIQRLQEDGVETFSLFRDGRNLYNYLEAPDEYHGFAWNSNEIPFLEDWPGEERRRYCVPMIDIYHAHAPSPGDSWRGAHQVTQRIGKIARIKPEQYGSYVYYHYQFQEERPGSLNKTYMIGSRECELFSYKELPVVLEPAPPGKLNTCHTPDNWLEVMTPHFEIWNEADEDQKLWRDLELVISL